MRAISLKKLDDIFRVLTPHILQKIYSNIIVPLYKMKNHVQKN